MNNFLFEKEGRDPQCEGSQEIDLFAQVALIPYGTSSACRLTKSSSWDLYGILISELASHLDAFSGYPLGI